MLSSIRAVRAELAARLDDPGWRVVDESAAKDETLRPAVYIEFVGLDSTYQGTPLPHGVLAAEVQVIITDPRTTPDGEGGVEDLLVALLARLDESDDLAWQQARKQRVERSGVWAWVLTLFAFVNTTTEGA